MNCCRLVNNRADTISFDDTPDEKGNPSGGSYDCFQSK